MVASYLSCSCHKMAPPEGLPVISTSALPDASGMFGGLLTQCLQETEGKYNFFLISLLVLCSLGLQLLKQMQIFCLLLQILDLLPEGWCCTSVSPASWRWKHSLYTALLKRCHYSTLIKRLINPPMNRGTRSQPHNALPIVLCQRTCLFLWKKKRLAELCLPAALLDWLLVLFTDQITSPNCIFLTLTCSPPFVNTCATAEAAREEKQPCLPPSGCPRCGPSFPPPGSAGAVQAGRAPAAGAAKVKRKERDEKQSLCWVLS